VEYHEETTKIEKDPGMMQSVEEHQEILTEDTAVMPVGERRKRRRVQKLAAERRQRPKEGTGGYCGFTGRLSGWRSWSELQGHLTGYEESWIGPCGGVDPLRNVKRNCR
jgi:hypothetical protein